MKSTLSEVRKRARKRREWRKEEREKETGRTDECE